MTKDRRGVRRDDEGYDLDLENAEIRNPKKGPKRVLVSVPFQRKQYEVVAARARAARMPLATYIRDTVLHFEVTAGAQVVLSGLTYGFEGGAGSIGTQSVGISTTFGHAQALKSEHEMTPAGD